MNHGSSVLSDCQLQSPALYWWSLPGPPHRQWPQTPPQPRLQLRQPHVAAQGPPPRRCPLTNRTVASSWTTAACKDLSSQSAIICGICGQCRSSVTSQARAASSAPAAPLPLSLPRRAQDTPTFYRLLPRRCRARTARYDGPGGTGHARSILSPIHDVNKTPMGDITH